MEFNHTRQSWMDYFLTLAKTVATRATCPRARVGCVLVKDNRVISTGYNGSPPGTPHCTNVGCDIVDNHCVRTVHAEANAIATAARFGLATDGATAYLTMAPCDRCRKLLDSAGVKACVYDE